MTTHIPFTREVKPEGWTKARPPGYYIRAAEAQRKRRQSDPDKYREMGKLSERRRKVKRYGLTQESYAALWKAQGEKCVICLVETAPHGRFWHTDHCHKTGQVRGILCHHCNLLLGNARDSIENLERAILYLKDSNV